MTDEPDYYNPDEVAAFVEQKETEASDDADAFRAEVERLQMAYIRVFKEGGASPEDRERVMHDLEVFTRGERTPWHMNDRLHCVLVGRHEVYTRIKHHTTLSLDALVLEKIVPKA